MALFSLIQTLVYLKNLTISEVIEKVQAGEITPEGTMKPNLSFGREGYSISESTGQIWIILI